MPCARNSAPPSFFASSLEHVDEQPADDLALGFRILDAGERLQEQLLGLDMHQRDVVGAAEQRDHLLGLAEPQQTVIDEHAGELLADRFMDQHGGDRGIDAAGQAADHLALADLLADFLDRLVLEGAHGPVAFGARDLAHEIAQERRAMRRVHHFEMELGGVEFALVVGDDGDRRIRRSRRPRESLPAARSRGRRGSSRPDSSGPSSTRPRIAACPRSPSPRRGRIRDDARPRPCRRAAAPSPARRSRCRAPARPLRRSRAARAAHPSRAPRPARRTGSRPSASSPEGFLGFLERDDLGIDALLAHPPRDELGDLRAEIDDEESCRGGGCSP